MCTDVIRMRQDHRIYGSLVGGVAREWTGQDGGGGGRVHFSGHRRSLVGLSYAVCKIARRSSVGSRTTTIER